MTTWPRRHDPFGEVLKCCCIGSVVFLCEFKQLRPGKIRILSGLVVGDKFLWRPHYLVFPWTKEECQWPPLLVVVHHRPMHAAFVFSITLCLHKIIYQTIFYNLIFSVKFFGESMVYLASYKGTNLVLIWYFYLVDQNFMLSIIDNLNFLIDVTKCRNIN